MTGVESRYFLRTNGHPPQPRTSTFSAAPPLAG